MASRLGHLLALGSATVAGYALSRAVFRDRYSFRDRVIVITGGSRGLGLELARQFVQEGAKVAICARTEHQVMRAVAELAIRGGDVVGFVCDITQPADVCTFISSVLNRWGRIDVLVNNAGVIQVGPMECMQRTDFEQAMATHLWGPINLVDLVLPSMRRRGDGRIVNISSIGGQIAVPHLLPYAASKFALRGWSEGLAAELRKDGILVTTVSPGMMRTGSVGNAEFKGRHRQEYALFAVSAATPILAIHSRTAARRIIEACRRGSPVVMVSATSAIAATVHAACCRLTIPVLGMIGGILPNARGGTSLPHKGWDSEPAWMPSPITALNQAAAVRNNEV